MATPEPIVEHLVVDSSGFFHNGPIRETGKHIYSCKEVVDEIKDKATRERLRILPYELKLAQVDVEAFKTVVEFAKKTGDYQQLSIVDLKLVALVYQLEKQYNKDTYINSEPKNLAIKPISIEDQVASNEADAAAAELVKQVQACFNSTKLSDTTSQQSMQVDEQEKDDNDDGENEDDDEQEGHWITPSNIEQVYQRMNSIKTSEPLQLKRVIVACMTSDFSMQNLLLQMGLLAVSPADGLMIKEAKRIALRCHACFKVIFDMTKLKNKFCPKCGNLDTLKRVSYVIEEDGSRRIQINLKKPIRVKGNNQRLPMPRGGKKTHILVLAPDQRQRQDRQCRAKITEKKTLCQSFVLDDPAYLVRSNPFAQR